MTISAFYLFLCDKSGRGGANRGVASWIGRRPQIWRILNGWLCFQYSSEKGMKEDKKKYFRKISERKMGIDILFSHQMIILVINLTCVILSSGFLANPNCEQGQRWIKTSVTTDRPTLLTPIFRFILDHQSKDEHSDDRQAYFPGDFRDKTILRFLFHSDSQRKLPCRAELTLWASRRQQRMLLILALTGRKSLTAPLPYLPRVVVVVEVVGRGGTIHPTPPLSMPSYQCHHC